MIQHDNANDIGAIPLASHGVTDIKEDDANVISTMDLFVRNFQKKDLFMIKKFTNGSLTLMILVSSTLYKNIHHVEGS
jgi:hypothetical protein